MSIIFSKQNDGTVNVLCAGRVVRDPEVKEGNHGTRVKFTVGYGKKQYMDCEAWADNDVGSVASCLEKDDLIAVMGTHRSWEYNEKKYSTLTADMIFTLAVPFAAEDAPPRVEPQQGGNESRAFTELSDNSEELPF